MVYATSLLYENAHEAFLWVLRKNVLKIKIDRRLLFALINFERDSIVLSKV